MSFSRFGWRRRAWEIEMKTKSSILSAALIAAALSVAPLLAEARPVGGAGPGYGHGGGGNWNHGGYGGWNHGGYGGWGYRGYWGPGYFWGGLGLGLGLGAIAYSAPYYGYYGGYGGYYAYPGYGPAVTEYVVVDPAAGDRVVRSAGQPVPAASHSPDPIFYPKSGQTPAKTESDRQECNRWATTQAGAMSDASIFQRATYACMEGRGYTVR
jgi:hypothetical protein